MNNRHIRGNSRVNIVIFVLIVLPFCTSACSQISGRLLVMEANYLHSRGMHDEAIAAYVQALEYEEAAPYAEYGLGSVYLAMGEEQAALERFAAAGTMLETFTFAGSRELRYRIHYNTGVVLFSDRNFSGAADSFREALKTDSGKIDAKRNLELSIRSHERENPPGGPPSGSSDDSAHEGRAVLFEYVRQKELNQWMSREWPEEEDIEGPDY